MLKLLFRILAVLFGVGAIAAATVITLDYLKKEMRKKGIQSAVVESINHSKNKVKFRDLVSGKRYELKGKVSDELHKGQIIHA